MLTLVSSLVEMHLLLVAPSWEVSLKGHLSLFITFGSCTNMYKQAFIDKSAQLPSPLFICLQVLSVRQTMFLNYTPGSMCSHLLVKHCGSGQPQFFTTLTPDSNGSWIGNDLNKSHKVYSPSS